MESETIYKVEHLEGSTYQVYKRIAIQSEGVIEIIQGRCNNSVLFQGTLPECESFINLTKIGSL